MGVPQSSMTNVLRDQETDNTGGPYEDTARREDSSIQGERPQEKQTVSQVSNIAE